MSIEVCPVCKHKYVIHEFQYPFKDVGGTLNCTECHTELFRYDKGTRDYTLEDYETYQKRIEEQEVRRKWEEENYPKCKCGLTMVKRKGKYGEFFGCVKFPKPTSCNKTEKI